MEANRNYIIILSVSLVLAGFFGAAAWLYYPYQMRNPSLDPTQMSRFFQAPSGVRAIQPGENQPESPLVGETPNESTQDLEIVYGILDDANFIDDPLGRRLNGLVDPPAETAVSTDNRLMVQVETRTPARELGTGTSTSPGVTSPSSGTPQSTQPVQGTGQSRASAPTAPQTPVAQQRVTQPTQSQITVEEYWIQVVSSPSRDRVQQVQEELESLGIGGRITTVQVDSQTFYRLRYGPYTQRAEAQKFLDWLREMPRYEESFISIEYRTRNQ